MNITRHASSVEEYVTAAAAAGDEPTRRAAALLLVALEPAVRLAIMNALADLADEVSDALGERTVEVRLDAGEARVVVSAPAERIEAPDLDLQGGEPSRVTLRLPEELKRTAEDAAAAQGVSLNTWLGQAVRDAVRGAGAAQTGRNRAGRVRGWVQG